MTEDTKFTILLDFYLDDVFDHQTEDSINELFSNFIDESYRHRFKLVVTYHRKTTGLKFENNKSINFFEISKRSPIIMFDSGFLSAKNSSIIFFQRSQSRQELPNWIKDGRLHSTENFSGNFFTDPEFLDAIEIELRKKIESYFEYHNHIEKVWFNITQGQTIFVVGGPDSEIVDPKSNISRIVSQDASEDDKKTGNLDIYNYGDKDTFIDSCIFLSKYLPKPKLIRTISSKKPINDNKYPRVENKENALVIGGPGSDADNYGNKYCATMMKKINSNIAYELDVEQDDYYMRLKRDENQRFYAAKVPQVGTNGDYNTLTLDYGYFASFRNPNNPKTRIILINGLHTTGVLGAFKTFSDEPNSFKNYATLLDKAMAIPSMHEKLKKGKMLDFECFFEVNIINDEPEVPEIRAERIFFFDFDNKPANVPQSTSEAPTETILQLNVLSVEDQQLASLTKLAGFVLRAESVRSKEKALISIQTKINKLNPTIDDVKINQIYQFIDDRSDLDSDAQQKLLEIIDK